MFTPLFFDAHQLCLIYHLPSFVPPLIEKLFPIPMRKCSFDCHDNIKEPDCKQVPPLFKCAIRVLHFKEPVVV